MARGSVAKKSYNVEAGVAKFTFSDGEVIEVSVNELPEATKQQYLMHGIVQRLGDSYSGAKDVEDEGGDPLSWAKAQVRAIWEASRNGVWTTRGEGGPRTTLLAEAVAAIYGKDVAEIVETLENMDDDQKKELRSHPKIAAKMAEIKAQRAAAAAERTAKAAAESSDLPAVF